MARLEEKCTHYKTVKCSPECSAKQCHMCSEARQLMKDNCQTCYQQRNSDCTHSDSERAITGFWTTAELNKALEKGYIINQIYEVLHFGNTSSDLWKEYIRQFMKIKLETSPFTCDEMVYRDKARQFGIELGELKKIPV